MLDTTIVVPSMVAGPDGNGPSGTNVPSAFSRTLPCSLISFRPALNIHLVIPDVKFARRKQF